MAILEIFREHRRPLGARDIADYLAMPRSSTNVLLRSMIARGYLRYDEANATYYPTLRVFHLGSWLIEGYLDDPALNSLLNELSARTRESVCVWVRAGTALLAIAAQDGPQAIALHVRTGATAPIFRSVVGTTMLAALADDKIESLIARWNRDSESPVQRDMLMLEIAAARLRGYCTGYDRWLPDAGAVAARLNLSEVEEPLVVAVGGPEFRVRRNEAAIIGALCELVQRFNRP